jgi:phosphopantothenoylcysteine decarboxylase/phosphopantothenate--cysteine ligase
VKIALTCGPSYEPIDGARRLTNFSTGRLGAVLANAFTARGWEVFCFRGEGATHPGDLRAHSLESFSTNDDLAARLIRLSQRERIDAVLHAAALCDFRVERVERVDGTVLSSRKFSTRDGDIRLVLAPAAKVLPKLRAWFPLARIVGWKYELEGTREDAFKKAWAQLSECATDACVLNGAAYGSGFAVCEPPDSVTPCEDSAALADFLPEWLSAPRPTWLAGASGVAR